ncbi:hypothetical protein BN1195_02987 [Chryseobacterium oranimense G311]|uniref:DUF4919 domain-containing protein n=1 Tax=Chryseobacterium oranimense TaxID=421058 RepID=UPI0005337F31|nr:DUF4919 domain-containing protein [Chryseobacterium oranimense]CEJ70659.1 hypothetical protein BN1195_02987 [Chryseobacterium oranimense G311]
MKQTIIILIFSLISNFVFGQINFDLIKKNVIENPTENFYPLMEKFRTNPSELTQDELNQLYYGSKFVKNDYSLGDYNKDYETIWKKASKKLSKEKAQKILVEAETKYQKNPLNKFVLKEMINLYSNAGDYKKLDIVNKQIELTEKTIEKSGDGKTEQNPICVIYPGDVLVQLERFSYVDRNKFEQKSKQLEDGSILTMYKMGDEVYYVKLVGGYF